MRYFIFALLWFASPAMTMSPTDLGNAMVIQSAPCSDHETRDHGFCYLLDFEGDVYLVFHDQEGARFVRRVRRDRTGYDTLWHRDANGPVPSGISL